MLDPIALLTLIEIEGLVPKLDVRSRSLRADACELVSRKKLNLKDKQIRDSTIKDC